MYALISISIFLILYILCKYNYKYRKLLIGASTLISIIYICWRFTTIPYSNGLTSFLLGILLYSSEVLGLIAFFNFLYLFNKNYVLEIKPLNNFPNLNIPFVDVLICTYNEPLDLLEKTIAACINLDRKSVV